MTDPSRLRSVAATSSGATLKRTIALLCWIIAAIALAPPAHAFDPLDPLAGSGLALLDHDPTPGLVYFEEAGAILALDPFAEVPEPKDIATGREPAVSPDGKRLAYLGEADGADQLLIADVDGTDAEPVYTARGPSDGGFRLGRPAWSPDGTSVAVADFVDDVAIVEVVPLEPGGTETVAAGLEGLGDTLSWSPDGAALAFDQLRSSGGPAVREVVALDVETGEGEALEQGTQPSYGPDGDIVFVRSGALWILPAGGDSSTAFVPPGASGEPGEFGHQRPAYSPDGRFIVFEREDGTSSWITFAPLSADQATRLTSEEGAACCPAWAAEPPPLPGISIADTSGVEGKSLLFTVSIPAPVGSPVTVTGTTQANRTAATDDYVTQVAAVTIPPGETEAVFEVATAEDTADEADEELEVLLSSPQGGVINDGLAVGTILDDDGGPPPPTVSVADGSALEGFDLRFAVSLSAPASSDVIVTATTSNGSATSPGDFTTRTEQVEIPAGLTEAGFVVATVDDTLDEAAESLTVTLTGPSGATIEDGTATGTIVDKSRVTVAQPTPVEEGGVLRFPVRLDHPAASDVTVRLATQDGTAVAPGDYTARGETLLTIAAGQTEAFFDVTTLEDLLDEGDETVTARILGGSGPASLTVLTTSGTVQNKPVPRVSVGPPPAVTEGAPLAFPVRLTAPRAGDVTVNLTTENGSASAPEDYSATSATVTIPAGQTEASFVVPTVDDGFDEPDETVTARILGGTNAFPTVLSAVGTILDNDLPLPVVRVDAAAAVDEGSPLRFPLRLDRAAPGPIDIRVSTADATATAPGDYTAQTLTLVRIPAGATEAFLEVPTATDSLTESDETVRAEIKSSTNASPSVLSAVGTIQDAEGAMELLPGQVLGGRVVSGKVFVRPPRLPEWVDLGLGAELPVGTRIDAREGVIELTSALGSRGVAFAAAQGRGRTQRARVSGGIFTIRQARRSPLVTLALTGRLRCRGPAAAEPVRRLVLDGAGRFRTKGRYAEGSSRNGGWLTEDRCGSTRVRATRGRVTVRDTVRKKARTVRKGRAVTIRARR